MIIKKFKFKVKFKKNGTIQISNQIVDIKNKSNYKNKKILKIQLNIKNSKLKINKKIKLKELSKILNFRLKFEFIKNLN